MSRPFSARGEKFKRGFLKEKGKKKKKKIGYPAAKTAGLGRKGEKKKKGAGPSKVRFQTLVFSPWAKTIGTTLIVVQNRDISLS